MKEIIVIGGGAAGMMAAIAASDEATHVTILEQNEKLGKKIYITGKGRCNVTNDSDVENLLNHVITNEKFLYSAFYSFTSRDMMKFLQERGLKIKTERGNRVFPVSDRSSDVIATLERTLRHYGVDICLHSKVSGIITEAFETEEDTEGKKSKKQTSIIKAVKTADGRLHLADAVVIATGGISYPATGATGDGYNFAKAAGHKVTDLIPGLVPMETKESWVTTMQGLSLRNVNVTIKDGKKVLYEEFGEMLFTHFGVSGPAVLSASSVIAKKLMKKELTLTIDLKPALSTEQLDSRILRDFDEAKNKQFKNSLGNLYPAKLIPVIIELSGISGDKKVNEISKEERLRLVTVTKNLTMTLTGLRSFKEAIITQGGVKVQEVNPSTMESKLVKNLYFAGEVLDLDAYTGGYNLQIAWSTGYAAGLAAAGKEPDLK